MVHEVVGQEEFARLTQQKGKLVVVDVSATWCGPCKRVAPEYDALSGKYPDVVFLKVMEGENQDLIMTLGVTAFPTFLFYLGGAIVDEVKGANIAAVEECIVRHRARVRPSFEGAGHSLGGGSAALSEADARAARLARFGAAAASGPPRAPAQNPNAALNAKILAADKGDDDPRFAMKPAAKPAEAPAAAAAAAAAAAEPAAMDVDTPAGGGEAADAPAPAAAAAPQPLRAVDEALLKQLMEEMGFPEGRARRALALAPQPGLEAAINWLMEHQEEAGVDDPLPEYDAAAAASAAEAAANSLKCDDCGALLRDMVAAELHAHKTGHSNFSESKEEITPLTPEERAAKVQALKDRLAARRAAREEEEKAESVTREKARRTMGKEMRATREEMEAQARMREIQMRKKEKLDAQRERERLRAEIAKDKAERKARGGKLAGKLGVEGYQPVGLQQMDDGSAPSAAAAGSSSAQPTAAASHDTRLEQAAKAIELLSQQRVAGEGGTAMKTINIYIGNVLAHPAEEKYRAISLDNKAFKARIAGCLGGVGLLRAIGFAKADDGGEARLVMSADARDEALLQAVKAKIDAALATYTQAQV